MKKKNNEGSSLVEVLIAIVIMAAIVVPTCTSMVLSFRVNAKADALTQSQFAVSSAVETLMAEGITDSFVESLTRHEEAQEGTLEGEESAVYYTSSRFAGLRFELEDKGKYFAVTVICEEQQVTVTTQIRDESSGTINWEEVSADEQTG